MLNNLVLCFNAVLPVFLYLAIGILIRVTGTLTRAEIRRVNHMVFVAFLPALMFTNIYGADVKTALQPKVLLFALTMIAVVFGIAFFLARRVTPDPATRSAITHTIYRSNFVILGLPVAINIMGGNAPVTASLMMAVVPLYNVLAVILLEYYRGGKADLKEVLLNILKNPLIDGAVLAILCIAFGIVLPAPVEKVVSNVGSAGSVMAMIVLGASFEPQSVGKDAKYLVLCVAGKLLAVPAIDLTLAYLLGFRGEAFVAILIMAAAPTAASAFTMAEEMGSNGRLTGSSVVFSTGLSVLTIFLWLFLFKTLGAF